jgi:hypothetical protein
MKKRILVMLVVLALLMMAVAVPAFAQGPEGGNPGNLLCFQGRAVGANDVQPLPFGGTEPEAGFNNAPTGVVFTSPGSPHSVVNPPMNPPADCPQ